MPVVRRVIFTSDRVLSTEFSHLDLNGPTMSAVRTLSAEWTIKDSIVDGVEEKQVKGQREKCHMWLGKQQNI